MASESPLVREFDTVLLLVNDGTRQFAEAQSDRVVRLRTGNFLAQSLVGAQYGAVYELVPRGGKGVAPLKLVESGELLPTIDLEAVGSGSDNRNLFDSSSAQSLGADDIARMKAEGADGSTILNALVEGSATFAGKTAFSQEKWLKKKGAKHVQRFRVVRTTPLNVAETAMLKNPAKTCGLRADALAMMLTHADLRPGITALVFDGVAGLVLAAAAHRMGCSGTIVAAHPKDEGGPLLGSLPKLNLGLSSDRGEAAKHALLFGAVQQGEGGVDPTPAVPSGPAPPPRPCPGGVDSVVVATPYDPLPLLLAGLRAAKPGCPFAVFCPHVAPLGSAFGYLRATGLGLNLSLAEMWGREYQVLPGRTHPTMSMHGASGYFLTGNTAHHGFARTAGALCPGLVLQPTAPPAASARGSCTPIPPPGGAADSVPEEAAPPAASGDSDPAVGKGSNEDHHAMHAAGGADTAAAML